MSNNLIRGTDSRQQSALNRSERYYFVAGVYEAAYLVNGILALARNGDDVPANLPARPDTNADQQLINTYDENTVPDAAEEYELYAFVSATLESYGLLYFPQPFEYNFIHRLLKITRTEDPKFLVDCVSFGHSSMTEKLVGTCFAPKSLLQHLCYISRLHLG